LFALVEARAELKADDTFVALHKRLASLESGLNERRAIFNDAVRQNNVRVGRSRATWSHPRRLPRGASVRRGTRSGLS